MLGQGATHEGCSIVLSAGLTSDVVHQQDDYQPISGLSNVDNLVPTPPYRVGQVIGAKKRKLGSVRMLKQDEAHQ